MMGKVAMRKLQAPKMRLQNTIEHQTSKRLARGLGGRAFGKIVTSFVNDVLMPPIGKAMGGVNFTDLFINLDPDKKVSSVSQAKTAGAAVIAYGQFINNVLDFLIVAACIFLVVKVVSVL